MSNNVDYTLYRKELFKYIASLTIKFHPFAEMMEKYVGENTNFTINNYRENPYYRNLCGEYSFLDTEMKVTSIDTGEQVVFNKDLWIEHPATATLYTYGSEEHKRLCGTYPTQVGLIKGIMYPVSSIDDAYNAPELTLLRHEPSFLRSNEQESLYNATIDFLAYIKDRWYIYDYGHEDQYYITFMAQLYCNLFSCLLKQRIENQDTAAVHSLHVWERLDSNGLSPYRTILTDSQARWFYRNMRYLKENRGMKSNIIILADNLLRNLKVKLVGKKIFQQIEDYHDDCIMVPEFLSDDILDYSVEGTTLSDIISSSIGGVDTNHQTAVNDTGNTVTSLVDMTTMETMDRILSRVHGEGYYPKYSADNSAEKEYRFGRTVMNSVPSRLLEFKKIDTHNPYERLLNVFLFDSLMYQSSNNKLKYVIEFYDEVTGYPVTVGVKDAIILMHYACHKQYDDTPVYLPKHCLVDSAYKMIPPTKAELPTHFHFNGYNYPISTIIKDEEFLASMTWTNGVTFHDSVLFVNKLGEQFEHIVKYIRKAFQEAHLTYQWALWYFNKALTVRENLILQQEDITYTTWMSSIEGMKALIDGYDGQQDPRELYTALAKKLVSYLLPVASSEILLKYVGSLTDESAYYDQLKQLFVDWTSHDLTYLDTDRSFITWIDFGLFSMTTSGESITSSIDLVMSDGSEYVKTYLKYEDIVSFAEYGLKPTLNNTYMVEICPTDETTDKIHMSLDNIATEIRSETNVYHNTAIYVETTSYHELGGNYTPLTIGSTTLHASIPTDIT